MSNPAEDASTLDRIIHQRETIKALSDFPLPPITDRPLVEEIVAAAAWAPFHKPAARAHRSHSKLSANLPWRCYIVDAAACRDIREKLLANGDDTKIPKMLAVATALIQVTWLPNEPAEPLHDRLFEPTIENMEHLAAASAAIQNVLLAATARGVPNYWSSGGALRSPTAFDWLDIPQRQILLGSIFLFPRDLSQIETAPGKLRHKRGDFTDWATWTAPTT